jgi:hypothetical protein
MHYVFFTSIEQPDDVSITVIKPTVLNEHTKLILKNNHIALLSIRHILSSFKLL